MLFIIRIIMPLLIVLLIIFKNSSIQASMLGYRYTHSIYFKAVPSTSAATNNIGRDGSHGENAPPNPSLSTFSTYLNKADAFSETS